MFRVQDLSIAFAIVVIAIFVGIGTGYFNRGPHPSVTASVPPPPPGVPAPPAPPAPPAMPVPPAPPAPVPPPVPGPAPSPGAAGLAINPGEYVDGTLKTWCVDTQGKRTENPASPFRLTILGSGQAQFRPGSPTGGGAVMPGTYDAATGKAQGRFDWPDNSAYTRWSATLGRNASGALTVSGLACSAKTDFNGDRCGGWFWGPPGSPEVKIGESDPGCGR